MEGGKEASAAPKPRGRPPGSSTTRPPSASASASTSSSSSSSIPPSLPSSTTTNTNTLPFLVFFSGTRVNGFHQPINADVEPSFLAKFDKLAGQTITFPVGKAQQRYCL